MVKLPVGVEGECTPRFARVAQLLGEHLAEGRHHGASVAIRHRGEPAVDLWGGLRFRGLEEEAWAPDTMAVSFSTSKGVAATALHMVMERHRLDYDTPVAALWPEFGRKDKDAVTIRHCLTHEAGIPQIRGEVADVWDMADWQAMVEMVERLEPLWEPGTANGYHAMNFGWLVGELIRRIDGRPLPQFLAEEIAGPLALDGLFIGAPSEEHHRVAPVFGNDLSLAAAEAILPPDHLLLRVLAPDGDMIGFVNSKEGLETVAPSFSGCFTARSLAKLYGALERGGCLEGVTLLNPATLAAATAIQNTRPDLVLMIPVQWRMGFMGGGSFLSPVGPHVEAFGHSGFGGSVAFADPRAEISMAITLDRLEIDLLVGERVATLVQAAVEAALAP
ncbi:MAG: beta-lactamase family protein [Actinobacteria bacterium]|nr:beta-lactamase family protein [Actinomycetota bacterium]